MFCCGVVCAFGLVFVGWLGVVVSWFFFCGMTCGGSVAEFFGGGWCLMDLCAVSGVEGSSGWL